MTVLYILEQGAHVRKDGQALLVEKEGKRIGGRPLKEVDSLILFGGVQASTQALLSLLDRGSRITLMTRNGHFRGSVVPAIGKNVTLAPGTISPRAWIWIIVSVLHDGLSGQKFAWV